ncbi:hypothetical protein NY08_5021 [Rhodococcus sp. B7740]|nr:hypothetical protein NY08_5021 [Rhodococcus sp. B7740]
MRGALTVHSSARRTEFRFSMRIVGRKVGWLRLGPGVLMYP